MKVAWASFMLTAAAGLFAAPVQAQLAPGHSGFSSAPRQGTTEEFWFSLRDLGNCFARTRARESRALLETEPSSPAEANAAGVILGRYTSCLRHASRMTASTNLVRGAIAEGLYRREVSAIPAPAEVARPAAIDRNASVAPVPYRLLADFARCFAMQHPQEVHRIISETALGSEAEHIAIAELEPLVSDCLPPNVRIQFEPSDIRLSLVEALYERSLVASAAQEGRR